MVNISRMSGIAKVRHIITRNSVLNFLSQISNCIILLSSPSLTTALQMHTSVLHHTMKRGCDSLLTIPIYAGQFVGALTTSCKTVMEAFVGGFPSPVHCDSDENTKFNGLSESLWNALMLTFQQMTSGLRHTVVKMRVVLVCEAKVIMCAPLKCHCQAFSMVYKWG